MYLDFLITDSYQCIVTKSIFRAKNPMRNGSCYTVGITGRYVYVKAINIQRNESGCVFVGVDGGVCVCVSRQNEHEMSR